jgi:hypothetical protein
MSQRHSIQVIRNHITPVYSCLCGNWTTREDRFCKRCYTTFYKRQAFIKGMWRYIYPQVPMDLLNMPALRWNIGEPVRDKNMVGKRDGF